MIYPIVLDPKHPITKLLIKEVEHSLLHTGSGWVLAELWCQYWIVQGRETVWKQQLTCRDFGAPSLKPHKWQELADQFCTAFIRHYLPDIKFHKWKNDSKDLSVVQVVFIVNPQLPRALWPVGTVTNTHSWSWWENPNGLYLS